MDNGYAMSLNLAIWVGAEMKDYMKSNGRILPDYQGNDSWILPIPASSWSGRTDTCGRASPIRIIASA